MRHYSIKSIKFSGYRKFGRVAQTVDFAYPDLVNPGSGLNVIVGSISSGKTSLLEIIGWACNIGLPDLDKMVINDSLKSGDMPEIHAEWIAPLFEADPEVTYETKSEFGMDGRKIAANMAKTYPDDLSGESYPNEGQLIKYIRPNRSFKGEVQNLGPSIHEGIDADNRADIYNLAGIVHYFSSPPHPGLTIKEFGNWIKKYSYLGLEIEDVRVSEPTRSGPNISHFEAKVKDGAWHNVQDLSDGAKELLWWIFELHFGDTNNYRIVCIDEIERSLHPQIQTVILEMIKERSRHQQYFITTHSTYIANPHIAKKIHRIDKDGIIHSADQNNFKKPSIFTVDHNRLFFTDDALFVEGIDDLAFFSDKIIEKGHQELLSKIFFANSKNNIDFFESICKKLGINFHAIVDDDYTDKVKQLNSTNRKMLNRVLNKLAEKDLVDLGKIDVNKLDIELAGQPKVEKNREAEPVEGKSYRKVKDRNIYPLSHGKLENYQQGLNRLGQEARKEQDQEINDLLELISEDF